MISFSVSLHNLNPYHVPFFPLPQDSFFSIPYVVGKSDVECTRISFKVFKKNIYQRHSDVIINKNDAYIPKRIVGLYVNSSESIFIETEYPCVSGHVVLMSCNKDSYLIGERLRILSETFL